MRKIVSAVAILVLVAASLSAFAGEHMMSHHSDPMKISSQTLSHCSDNHPYKGKTRDHKEMMSKERGQKGSEHRHNIKGHC